MRYDILKGETYIHVVMWCYQHFHLF